MDEKDYNIVQRPGVPTVIELKPNIAILALETLLEMAKAGRIEKFIFAGFDSESNYIYSKTDTTAFEQQQLVGYLQSEATIRTFEELALIDRGGTK